MKFVVVILVVLVCVWLWRRNRAEEARDEPPVRQTPTPKPEVLAPAEMVSCAHCGLHLPAQDAVTGARSRYCSQDHLRQHEA